MPVVFGYSRVEDCKNKMNSINDSTVINIDLEILSNEYSIAESIVIGVIWLLIQTVGNCFHLIYLDYFYNSGDPLKWKIVDHVS